MNRSTNYRQASMLIIDDNADHWTIMQSALQTHLPHVQAIWTTGANSTLSYLDECIAGYRQLPKLIMLDLYLPTREQGQQLLQTLKNHPLYNRLPVVVISYSGSTTDVVEAYNLGSASYLVKPTEMAGWLTLFQVVKNYWWDTTTLPNSYR